MKDDYLISRWKLNCENFSVACSSIPSVDYDIMSSIGWTDEQFKEFEQGELKIINDFIARKIVDAICDLLERTYEPLKFEFISIVNRYCLSVIKTGKNGAPFATPKLLTIDKLYPDRPIPEIRQKWFLFYYLFDLDEIESTSTGKIDVEKQAEF